MTPFDSAYNEIFAALASVPGKKVAYIERDNRLRTVQDSDLPETSLVLSGGETNICAATNLVTVAKYYDILCNTGEQSIASIHALEWAILKALSTLTITVASVTRVSVEDITEGLSDPEQNRNIKGWSAIWRIKVDFAFDKGTL